MHVRLLSLRPRRSGGRALLEPPSPVRKTRWRVSPSRLAQELAGRLGHPVTIPGAERWSLNAKPLMSADIIRPLLWQEELPASFFPLLNLRNSLYEGYRASAG
jgi:hypothetical protein